MVTEIIFDVETKKLFSDITTDNPGDLGVSIVSTYKRTLDESLHETQGEMRSFWEQDFPLMWPWFEQADRIIGFNSLKFDVPALQPYYTQDFSKLHHFDIMDLVRQKIGRRISLNALAQETLGNTKIDVGTNAVIYWAKGDEESLAKLKKYCEADVALTRDLYDAGIQSHGLKYRDKWNGIATIDVDFSYPVIIQPDTKQIGLF